MPLSATGLELVGGILCLPAQDGVDLSPDGDETIGRMWLDWKVSWLIHPRKAKKWQKKEFSHLELKTVPWPNS